MVNSNAMEASGDHYQFGSWADRVQNFAKDLTHRFLVDPSKIDGFKFIERRAIPDDNHHFIDYFSDVSNEQVVIAVTLKEHQSIAEAHEHLKYALMHSMAPNLPFLEEDDVSIVGDIGFGGHGEVERAVFFTRANLMITVESVGDVEVDVLEFVKKIDEQIVSCLNS